MRKLLRNMFYDMAMNSYDSFLRHKEKLESIELCNVDVIKTNSSIAICKKIGG